MGFITGFLSGATLTTSILYLTLQTHTHTRHAQRALLRDSQTTLLSLLDAERGPPRTYTPPSARERHAGLAETAKDAWNGEVERLVRRAQGVDWRDVEGRVESGVGRVWRGVVERFGEGKGRGE